MLSGMVDVHLVKPLCTLNGFVQDKKRYLSQMPPNFIIVVYAVFLIELLYSIEQNIQQNVTRKGFWNFVLQI